jgi:large subunit ribosomal protein L35
MPKIKTNRSAAKRFSFTKSGRVKHKKAFLRHLNSSKNRSRKRHLRRPGMLGATDAKRVHLMVPYK